MKFMLNGCDISFVAEAPDDMTVKELVELADQIHPDWCACGVCSASNEDEVEIIFEHGKVRKASDDVCCQIYKDILPRSEWYNLSNRKD